MRQCLWMRQRTEQDFSNFNKQSRSANIFFLIGKYKNKHIEILLAPSSKKFKDAVKTQNGYVLHIVFCCLFVCS